MTETGRIAAGRPWTTGIRYSRAVRRGPLIEVSGTTATSADGTALYPGDAYGQARYALEAMVDAIERLGGTAGDVIRTRVFVTSVDDWKAVGRAHDEIFGDTAPASTVVEVSGFLLPELLVELEAAAYVLPGVGGAS